MPNTFSKDFRQVGMKFKTPLHALPQYLSNEMERLQKFALWIIQPNLSYTEALVALDITSLYERRQALSKALIDQIVRDQGHKAAATQQVHLLHPKLGLHLLRIQFYCYMSINVNTYN